jgi:ABC-type antimicrobial peptide transport system permease subunit
MMIRWSALIAASGIAAGLLVFAPLSRTLGALLFGIPPSDPVTIGLVVVFLGAVAMIASLVPARRAARVDPVEALRQT